MLVGARQTGEVPALSGTNTYSGPTNVAGGNLRATLVTLPPDGESFDWLVLAPDGSFASSPGVAKSGKWFKDKQSVAFAEAAQAFQRPLVLK